jgi:hypothetical protein
MPSFDDREKGFEAKYSHDQELNFKITVRRNKMLGQWAAEQLGKTGAEAEAYVKEVIASDFEKPGEDDIVGKVVADLKAKGIDADADAVRRKLHHLGDDAARELKAVRPCNDPEPFAVPAVGYVESGKSRLSALIHFNDMMEVRYAGCGSKVHIALVAVRRPQHGAFCPAAAAL